MIITGYMLMDRLEELKEQAKTLDSQFTGALYKFEGEEKPDPRELVEAYGVVEAKITAIQEAQARYNLAVTVTVLGETMTLHRAVRQGSVAARAKNHWKTAAADTQHNPFMARALARDKEHEYAQRQVSVEECLRLAEDAGTRAAAYKRAIRAGNAVELEVPLDPTVFE